MLLDRPQQRRRLQAVAAGPDVLDDAAVVDVVLHRRHDQPLAELGDAAVAELVDLGEVVAGVDVHERERELAGPERLLGQAQQDDRVLAAAEQQHGALELGRHLAHDEDRLGLERVEVGEAAAAAGRGGEGRSHVCGVSWAARGASFVEPALGLVGAGPPAGAGVLAGLDRLGARPAADGRVALVEQRVVGDVVVGDVAADVDVGPRRQRVDLDQARAGRATRSGRRPGSAPRPGAGR